MAGEKTSTLAEALALAGYRAAGMFLTPLALPAAAAGLFFADSGEVRERLGFVPENRGDGPLVWVHAASVGEVKAAGVLIRAMRAARPGLGFLLSTVTRQGMAAARRASLPATALTYAPLDLPGCVALALARARPAAYLCLETELWPGMFAALRQRGVPAALANARMSARSLRRYLRARALARPLARGLAAVCAITAADRERYLALGARPETAQTCGNLKYDQPVPPDEEEKRQRFRAELGISESTPLLVAGSTRSGEEEMLAAAYRQERGRLPGMRLVIAPRHLNRVEEVEETLARAGLGFVRFSQRREKQGKDAEVVLVDTMGDLPALYGLATWAFCGGSLVERGGHNIMEAAARGVPVFHGPHMDDFADAAAVLDGNGGIEVASAGALFEAVANLPPQSAERMRLARAAAATAAAQVGAAARQTETILAAIGQDIR